MKQSLLVLLSLLCTGSLCAEQIDYQPEIDNYQNLFACSYLAKHALDTQANVTFSQEEFPNRDRLKLFFKMVTHCRGQISLQTSATLIQTGFDYDEKFAQPAMQEQVRALTNYGGFIRNKNALGLSERDKETVDLMFEISKNEGERHGKMPTFGRNNAKPPKKSATGGEVPPKVKEEEEVIVETPKRLESVQFKKEDEEVENVFT